MIIKRERYKSLQYILSYPGSFRKEEKYPVLFHMHGAGSRGTDLDVLNIDVPIRKNPAAEEMIIVAPQCFADTWFEIFEQLIEFCEYIYGQKYTDRSQFYASGISMGGYAAYQLMMSRAQLFAAGIVCCGGGMYWNSAKLKNIPLRIFHGEKDSTVLPCESIHMAEKINTSGGKAFLTLYPECGHNCWERVFADKSNFNWLLLQKKIYD